jgi:1-acyl-sn-glycerol-3-phosphate acyltransferase
MWNRRPWPRWVRPPPRPSRPSLRHFLHAWSVALPYLTLPSPTLLCPLLPISAPFAPPSTPVELVPRHVLCLRAGQEAAIVMCNHRSDVDWLVGWVQANVRERHRGTHPPSPCDCPSQLAFDMPFVVS